MVIVTENESTHKWIPIQGPPWVEVKYCPSCRDENPHRAKYRNFTATWAWFTCQECKRGRPVEL